MTADGQVYTVGDTEIPFTIQSVSKPFAFGMALEACGPEKTYQHVGTEATGDSFNAITLNEVTNRPFNPMVNAGAISIPALIHDACSEDPFDNVLSTFGRLAGRKLELDETVFNSERETGHRNRTMAHLMRYTNIIGDPVEEKLDLYFRQCAIRAFVKGITINCSLRLVLDHFWASDMCTLFVTPH